MCDRTPFDLDVAAPDDAVRVLRRAAELYRESAEELRTAWQTDEAARPWNFLATQLEVACEHFEREWPAFMCETGRG
jgi:hypothetical protein